jgi:hypothetical protein
MALGDLVLELSFKVYKQCLQDLIKNFFYNFLFKERELVNVLLSSYDHSHL